MNKKFIPVICILAAICLVSGAYAILNGELISSVSYVSDNIENTVNGDLEEKVTSDNGVLKESSDVQTEQKEEKADVVNKPLEIYNPAYANFTYSKFFSDPMDALYYRGAPINEDDFIDRYWQCPICGGFKPIHTVTKPLPEHGICILGQMFSGYLKKTPTLYDSISYEDALKTINDWKLNTTATFEACHGEDVEYMSEPVRYYPEGTPEVDIPLILAGKNVMDATKIFELGHPVFTDRYGQCFCCGLFTPVGPVTTPIPANSLCIMNTTHMLSPLHYNYTVSYEQVMAYIQYHHLDTNDTYAHGLDAHEEDLHPPVYEPVDYSVYKNWNNSNEHYDDVQNVIDGEVCFDKGYSDEPKYECMPFDVIYC